MAFTSHGHQIRGTKVEGSTPLQVARCGGPGLCTQCSREAAVVQSQVENATGKNTSGSVPYPSVARLMVFEYAQEHLHRSDVEKGVEFTIDNVFIVWFSKTLQNWKCLVSTTLLDGMYYEVTFNGDKNEAYLDAYKKFDSKVIPVG